MKALFKKCTKCLKEKEISEFSATKADRGCKYNRASRCKACLREGAREYRRREPEAYNRRAREWKMRNKEKVKKVNSEWRKKSRDKVRDYFIRTKDRDKLKTKARVMVKEAVKTGDLINPSYCVGCLSYCVTECHHEDYSKPLNVLWLCRPCHAFVHSIDGVKASTKDEVS